MNIRTFMLAAAMIGAASVVSAQQKEPLPRAVADLRAASAGLPTGIGWTPAVPEGTLIPGRGLGLDAGAHVYFARFKLGAIGVGSTVLLARGKAAPPEAETSSSTPVTALPAVSTKLTAIVPQVSFNFGHRLGWSYISGGLGRTRVTSRVAEPLAGSPVAPAESGWARTINYGGGARWFINDHLAVNLDLRWYKIARVEATPTTGALPKQSLVTAGAGISIK
jgi:opacity protein-like surface antigen